jgi:hypothetical protein
MTFEQILQSFAAFNVNSLNNVMYIIKTNLWTLLTVAGALTIIILNLKEEIEDTVTERQTII